MHALAKKFMMARKLNFGERGEAELLDDTVFLMDSTLLPAITEHAGEDGSYAIGEVVGSSLADNVGKTGISGTKMDEFMLDLLTMMGLGRFEVHDFDITSKEGEVRVENCIIGREEGSDNCAIVAGLLAGVFGANYEKEFTVEEAGCILAGDDICRFKIQT